MHTPARSGGASRRAGPVMTQMPELQTRAECYLTLARAFLSPSEADWEALRDGLPADLGDFATELGYPIGHQVEALARDLHALDSALPIQQAYGALFLQPPAPAHLNAAIHLDGALLGGSSIRMEEIYRRHGVERSDEFPDLPDHLSLQLHFVALLLGRAALDETPEENLSAAGDFLHEFIVPWVGRFAVQVYAASEERELPMTYAHLARILATIVPGDAQHLAPRAPTEAPVLTPAQRLEQARHRALLRGEITEGACKACGTVILPDREMRKLRQTLAAKGMDIAHLDYCPDCRSRQQGWQPGSDRQR